VPQREKDATILCIRWGDSRADMRRPVLCQKTKKGYPTWMPLRRARRTFLVDDGVRVEDWKEGYAICVQCARIVTAMMRRG
jgi:hypothetical protein